MNHGSRSLLSIAWFLCIAGTGWLHAQSAAAQLTIVKPQNQALVSGPSAVVLQIDNPADVITTRLFLNGEVVGTTDGWRAEWSIDFGERFDRQRLEAEVALADNRTLRSTPVITRELAISVTARTELMLIGAVVKDRRNQSLTDLKKDRFEVFENGRELPIQAFYNEELPLDVVLMLDTSSSLRGKGFPEMQQAARVFIQQLRTADRGMLYEFKDEPLQLTDFTHEQSTLLQVIDKLDSLGATALFDALHSGVEAFENQRTVRKAIVLFTDGKDSVYESPRDKADMLRAGITAAQNREITVYTIGLGENINKDALRRIADDTGGRFHHADNVARLPAIFGEIIEELKHQYVLGVQPQSSRSGFNEIKVKVRKRGTEVFARKGYTRD